jgi:hypothetical protein
MPSSRSIHPTALVVATGFLVPNALEAATVAMTSAAGATLVAGALSAVVLLAAALPLFGASIRGAGAELVTAPLRARLAAFTHPVLIDGLRDESQPLLRAHALIDFAVAGVVAAVSGATQAGALVGGSCVPAALVMFAGALGLTGYYAVVRPFAARLEVAVATAQAGTLAVLCGLTLGAVATGGTSAEAWGDRLSTAGLVAEVLTFAGPVVLLAAAARQRFAAHPVASDAFDAADTRGQPAHEVNQPLLQMPPRAAAPELLSGCAQGNDEPSVHAVAIANPLTAAAPIISSSAARDSPPRPS